MNRRFLVRRSIARAALRAARWNVTGTVPQKGILVGAPHTSNWDWVATILMSWSQSTQPTIMVKKEHFKGPFGPLLKSTGSIPIDRKNPGETVRELLAHAEGNENFCLAIAAEGTRSKAEYWKSGFYRISAQTGLPIALGFIDGPTRTVGVGPIFTPTGNVTDDMNRIREFYADKLGINPEMRTEPRLREEGETG
ncbi:1-acyl-sn-glycerol-3-phosphate acyltransferase [Antrihabitans sp. YC2-6]|uniref:1-acyl-sn-glycerol-3-phosphate acyltransferase n=1 Tax=Antrihabitans sp. YC2-6 TaxID=2799498 RepID=UPI0018F5C3B5|nr:1-acyl-sn-glycerol-3-phosphate acyltransferase [Antrihabitans sp. YC2-6]MBJ8348953.1 1-acyl-sn-glycerol-3-phosphate acyltransferase [Antrihabitans sp. YC2-6]